MVPLVNLDYNLRESGISVNVLVQDTANRTPLLWLPKLP